MTQKTNNFERFWKELKRRKVVHVITVYAAVAFVILQLVDMVAEPLRLPVSTKALVIVLLCIGFIIAIFLSWVYDITPTGVKKTKPVSSLKHTDHTTTPSSSGWKIATYISGAIIIALVAFNFISRRSLNADISKLPKSIAVLPFINDSHDTTNAYFINGIMERITTNLQMVKELRVISRTSVEQYRNTTKSIPEIAKELNVSYILGGSGQKYGSSFSVTVQLIKAIGKETNLWAKPYDQEIKEVNDYIKIESQIAQAIAAELKAIITPKEKQLIENTPTADTLAYDFYLKGNDYWSKLNSLLALNMYSKAIQEDSLFAAAYAKRALMHLYIWWSKSEEWQGHDLNGKEDIERGEHLNPDLLDIKFVKAVAYYWLDRDYDKSIQILNELKTKAPNMADLYAFVSYNLRRQGKWEESVSEAKRSIQLDPFNANYITNLSQTYDLLHQYDNMIENSKQGLFLIPDYKGFNNDLFYAYLKKTADLNVTLKESGLKEDDFLYERYYYSRQYGRLIEFLSKDTAVQGNQTYYLPQMYRIALIYHLSGNRLLCKIYADSAITHLNEKLKEIPNDDRIYATLGKCYAFSGNFKEAIACGKKAVDLKPIKLDAYQGVVREQDLMEIYLLTGNYELALDKIEFLLSVPSWLTVGSLIIDPIFDNLHSLPRFQKIID
jgi:TolB-like protein